MRALFPYYLGKTELGTSVFSQEDIRHTVDLAWQRQQHQHQTVKTQVQEKSNRKKEVCICRARRGASQTLNKESKRMGAIISITMEAHGYLIRST